MPSMKKLLLSVALLVSVPLVTFAQQKNTSAALADTVLRLEQQWENALTNSDISALDKLYDDTMVYTHSNGKVDTKETYLSAIKSGATKYQSMTRDDIKVSVYGHAAVVTCHWEVHILARGNKIDMNARYLHVYAEQPNGWKLVAHESTRIAP
jgi:ketosteroid isomerase-like protein